MNEAKFVWHELMTVDPMAAKKFYPKLFGWTFRDQEMGGHTGVYTMWLSGDRGVGGMMAIDKGHGLAPAWNGYVEVPDVDAAARRATGCGGKILVPPTDIPDVGRFAMIQDTLGSVVNAFKYAGPDMPEESPTPGEFCWDELQTSDPRTAIAFYTEVMGWKIKSANMGGGFGEYHLLQWGEKERGGIVESRDGTSRWLSYVSVDNVDAMTRNAEQLGAKLLAKPMDMPMGRFAVLADPAGASFALWKSLPRK